MRLITRLIFVEILIIGLIPSQILKKCSSALPGQEFLENLMIGGRVGASRPALKNMLYLGKFFVHFI